MTINKKIRFGIIISILALIVYITLGSKDDRHQYIYKGMNIEEAITLMKRENIIVQEQGVL